MRGYFIEESFPSSKKKKITWSAEPKKEFKNEVDPAFPEVHSAISKSERERKKRLKKQGADSLHKNTKKQSNSAVSNINSIEVNVRDANGNITFGPCNSTNDRNDISSSESYGERDEKSCFSFSCDIF